MYEIHTCLKYRQGMGLETLIKKRTIEHCFA